MTLAMRSPTVTTVAAALVALLLSGAAPARAEKFRYKFRPGQTHQNRISMAGAALVGSGTQSAKSQFRSVLRQVQRVRSVSGGVATLEVTEIPQSNVTITDGQTERSKEPPTRSLVKLTDRGRFLSRQRLGGGGDLESGSPLEGADALYGLNFPARDLKPGESWTDTIPIDSGAVPRKVNVTTKYVKKETIRGRKCAKFLSTVSMPLIAAGEASPLGEAFAPTGKMLGSVTTYFDPLQGVEVYASGWISMVMKADLTALSPEAGEISTATRINVVQQLLPPKR